jgi:hypothetical protein
LHEYLYKPEEAEDPQTASNFLSVPISIFDSSEVLELWWNVSIKIHTIMENARSLDDVSPDPVEDHMPADVEGSASRKNLVPVLAAGRKRIGRDFDKTLLQ